MVVIPAINFFCTNRKKMMKMHKETKLESYAFKLYGQKEDGMVAIFRSEQRFSFIKRRGD